MTLAQWLSLDLRRRHLARKVPPGALRDFYAIPFPSPRLDWREIDYVALDLETTGGSAALDHIVSMGWVCIEREAIVLASAVSRVVRSSMPMPESSAIIHAITDDEVAEGDRVSEALTELLAVLRGRVLIAHHAATEIGFLDAACRRVYGHGFLAPAVDTLELARQWYARRALQPARGELRLVALRDRYQLPPYSMHDALSDAMATAELFLAQSEERSSGGSIRLGRLLSGN